MLEKLIFSKGILSLAVLLCSFGMPRSVTAQMTTAEAELARIIELFDREQFQQARPLAERLLNDAAGELGQGTLASATAQLYAGMLHAREQKFDAALREVTAARAILDKPQAAKTPYGDLVLLQGRAAFTEAYALIGLNRSKEAEAPYLLSQRLLEAWPDPRSLDYRAGAQMQLGDLNYGLNRRAEAIGRYRQSVALLEQRTPPQPATIAFVTNKLAITLIYEGLSEQALVVLAPAIARIGATADFPPTNGTALNLLHNEGFALKKLQRFEEAVAIYDKLVASAGAIKGFDPQQMALLYDVRGTVYSDWGKFGSAAADFETAQKLLEKSAAGVARDNALALLVDHVASLHMRRGDPAAAVAAYRKIVAADLSVTAPVGERGMVLINMANALASTNQATEAEKTYKAGLASIEAIYGKQGPYFETALNNLGWFYIERGRHDEAQPLLVKVVELRTAANSPHLAVSIGNLALALKRQGRTAEAHALNRQAIGLAEKQPAGTDNPLYSLQLNLGVLDEVDGDLPAAERSYRSALNTARATFGASPSPAQYAPLSALAALAQQRGQYDVAVDFFRQAQAVKARFQLADPLDDGRAIAVLYATDRNAVNVPGRTVGFGSQQADRLAYGSAVVTVPAAHKATGLEAPSKKEKSTAGSELYQDIALHMTISSPTAWDEERFVAGVRRAVTAGSRFRGQALVYIHGYNVSFDNALMRMGQITADTGFDGAALVYSWASNGALESYLSDEKNALASSERLAAFLRLVAERTGVTKIHVIVHSMGNQAFVAMLEELKTDERRRALKIGQLILAAPDVDATHFSRISHLIVGSAEAVTLYVGNDRALLASRLVHPLTGFGARAGAVPMLGAPVIVPGVETVDVAKLGTSGLNLNHSLYADTEPLLADIGALIERNVHPPDRRGFARVPASNNRVYWRYD